MANPHPLPFPFLTKGSQVEVSSDDTNLHSPWYVATVIHPPLSTNNLVYLEYNHLLSGDDSSTRLREYANVAYVRPSPVPDKNPNFELNDVVDAFYKDGWCTGVITSVIADSIFGVTFHNTNEQVQFHCSQLRVHRRWVAGRWLHPRKQGTAGLMFTVGKKVEVSFEREGFRDCWVPATILKNSDNNTFLVEYQQPGTGGQAIYHKVTVDYLHIRPSPPHLRDKNFVLLEKVDAYYDFAWWSGVITKVFADNRYNVFFKRAKKEREFIYSRVRPHMEWKGGKWFNASQGDTDGRTTNSFMDEQIEQTMTGTNNTSLDMNGDLSEKTNRPSVGLSEGSEVSGMTDQALGKTENLSHVMKEHSTLTSGSTRKRGKLSSEHKSLEASDKGFKVDSMESRSQEIVGKKDITKDFASPVVIGLHCNGITISHGHTLQKQSIEKTPNVAENVPFSPLTDGNEGNAASVAPKRKRGRPPKLQGCLTFKTTVTFNNQSGSGVVQNAKSLVENQGPVKEQPGIQNPPLSNDKLPKESTGRDLDIQPGQGTQKHSTKNGKRKTISINSEYPAQEGNVEQSLMVSFKDLPFVRTTSLWKTIEQMEAFRMLPQNPHFRPLLEGVKESAREGLAVGTVVTFSTIVDKTRTLRSDEPRSTIEDCLETLVELENNGFDVKVVRDRLTGLLLIKDKQEELAERSKQIVERIKEHNGQRKKDDEEIKAIDRQIRELEEKRKQVVLKKEKKMSDIGVMEVLNGEIENEMRGVGVEFDGLVAAPFVRM